MSDEFAYTEFQLSIFKLFIHKGLTGTSTCHKTIKHENILKYYFTSVS